MSVDPTITQQVNNLSVKHPQRVAVRRRSGPEIETLPHPAPNAREGSRIFPYECTREVVVGDAPIIRYVGSDMSEDRYGSIIDPSGCRSDDYMKSGAGVFCFAHDYGLPPVGKCIDLEKTKKRLIFTILFATDIYDGAAVIYRLVRDGYMPGSSVGFLPVAWEEFEAKTVNPYFAENRRYTEWELLELSAVPVPANRNAIAMGLSKALGDGALSENAVRELSLDRFIRGDFLYVTTSRHDEPKPAAAAAPPAQAREGNEAEEGGKCSTEGCGHMESAHVMCKTCDCESYTANADDDRAAEKCGRAGCGHARASHVACSKADDCDMYRPPAVQTEEDAAVVPAVRAGKKISKANKAKMEEIYNAYVDAHKEAAKTHKKFRAFIEEITNDSNDGDADDNDEPKKEEPGNDLADPKKHPTQHAAPVAQAPAAAAEENRCENPEVVAKRIMDGLMNPLGDAGATSGIPSGTSNAAPDASAGTAADADRGRSVFDLIMKFNG